MTTSASTTIAMTPDDILAGTQASCHRYSVIMDNGTSARVLSVTGRADGTFEGFAETARLGLLCAFRQSGKVVKDGMIRVQVAYSEDTGDQAGTVSFDFTRGATPGQRRIGALAR